MGARLRRRWYAPQAASGTNAKKLHGRSSRRPPGSGCTPMTSSRNCSRTRQGYCCSLVNEEIAWGDAGIAVAILGSTLAVACIVASGTPEQVAEWVREVLRPKPIHSPWRPFASPSRRPGPMWRRQVARSSTTRPTTLDFNGTKSWITNGGIADLHVVVARWTRGQALTTRRASSSHRGPRDSPWVETTQRSGSGPRTPPKSCCAT